MLLCIQPIFKIRDGGACSLHLFRLYPFLQKLFADGGYQGRSFKGFSAINGSCWFVFGENHRIIRSMTHELSNPSFHPAGEQPPVEAKARRKA